MKKKPLNKRQIFGMKRDSLEKRIFDYYSVENDSAYIIECLVAVFVRNALVISDFSLIASQLVRELFFSAEPNKAMRHYYPFFENYFNESERDGIITRLFQNKNNYYKNSKKIRHLSKLLNDTSVLSELPTNQEMVLKTIFEDANGKMHTWVLRDVDPLKEKKKFEPILNILTMLTIFEKDGVRHFVHLVDSKRVKSDIEVVVERKKVAKKTAAGKNKATKKSPVKNSVESTPDIQVAVGFGMKNSKEHQTQAEENRIRDNQEPVEEFFDHEKAPTSREKTESTLKKTDQKEQKVSSELSKRGDTLSKNEDSPQQPAKQVTSNSESLKEEALAETPVKRTRPNKKIRRLLDIFQQSETK